jgi:hypothetical protein
MLSDFQTHETKFQIIEIFVTILNIILLILFSTLLIVLILRIVLFFFQRFKKSQTLQILFFLILFFGCTCRIIYFILEILTNIQFLQTKRKTIPKFIIKIFEFIPRYTINKKVMS